MKIGIDFGTTYTKIAYLDPDGNLRLFQYPAPPNNQKFIPSAIAYRTSGGAPLIGEAARMALAQPKRSKVVFYESFKMLLPSADPISWKDAGWPEGHTPMSVTGDFFTQLLRDAEFSFQKTHGAIQRLVVSVPEIWQRTLQNEGAATLQRTLVDDLGLPLAFLKSEPVCAAAYYVYRNRQLDTSNSPFNLLVCDVGGGTFDVALCHVEAEHVSVLYFDGNGQPGLGQAGSLFDRQAVQIAYNAAVSEEPLHPESSKFARLLQEFEKVKMTSHDEVADIINEFNDNPVLADTELYFFHDGEYTLTLNNVQQAFEPVKIGMQTVLNRVLEYTRAARQPIQRVVLIGGFARFPLVEKTIHQCLDAGMAEPLQFDTSLNSEERFYAVALGATLIANDVILPVEYYPHTLGVYTYRQLDLEKVFIHIVEAGKTPIGQPSPAWASTPEGQPLVIRVEEAHKPESLPVFYKQAGQGKLKSIKVAQEYYPVPGVYQIGLVVDESGLGTLVFEPVEQGEKKLIPLSNIFEPQE